MARFCTNCGNSVDDAAAFCPKCGASSGTVSAGGGVAAQPAAAASGLTDNVAGMLAYVTLIPAIIFLVVAPYNQNRFIRFHSFQCIFFCVALIVLNIALGFIPIIGIIAGMLLSLVALAIWIVLLLKAYQGQKWKLPVIGDIAEKQADAM